jgi:hypothetical protein
MKEKNIKVGFCVAYDWVLLKRSIPRIYQYADIICLSLDKNRKTWSGEKYPFDEHSFREFVAAIDTQNKIDVYEDDFCPPSLSAMENDTRQRNLMAQRMGAGGWHVQIDSDEYFLNFENCISRLISLHEHPTGEEKSLNVCSFCIPIIKKLTTGFLYIDFQDKMPETLPFATTLPVYKRARLNGHFNILLPEYVIHETWARSEEELWLKMNNWGHASEELDIEKNRLSYYNFWKVLDDYNYRYVSNFHPAIPPTWPTLKFMRVGSVEEFLMAFEPPDLPLSPFQLWMKNNRQVSRVRSYSKKMFKLFS